MFGRLSSTTSVLALSTLIQIAAGHALPVETKTVGQYRPNIVDWPIVATLAPVSPAELQRRGFNTVCGYIGGDPAFPATCLAGSHCAVDTEHGAIGCCPNGAPCSGGVFTDCVDVNSPPQTVLDPYVFTCSGTNVCYKNSFDGGYFQYGCGSVSQLATRVATSAVSRSALDFSRMSVALTATPTKLATPTTIGDRKAVKTQSSSDGTSTDKSSGDTSSAADATSTSEPQAPGVGGGSSSHTGAIVGGVIGGLAAFVLLGGLLFWLMRRKQKAALPDQYIT